MKKSDLIIILLIVIILVLIFIVAPSKAFTSLRGGKQLNANNTWAGHNIIYNNTAQGKAYINSSLYPNNIRFGTWNISYTKNKQSQTEGNGEINIFANNSGFINTVNESEPYSKSGCFRINGANNLGANGWTIPGTVHIGSECTQGWPQAYIDINDVTQKTSQVARLMQFWWTNTGPGNGIGMSMILKSKSTGTVLQDFTYNYQSGAGSQASTIQMMKFGSTGFLTNNSIPIGEVRVIDILTWTVTGMAITKLVGLKINPPTTNLRMRGLAGMEIGQGALVTRTQVVGMFMGRQSKSSSASNHNRSFALISEGNPIQLSAGTAMIYNGEHLLTNAWQNISLGNVSQLYNYDNDILVTQFAGRTSGLFNLTKMSKRQYNLSFADYVRFNDTLKIGGNATHSDVKIDKTNFTIKSFNSTAYLNCGYFKSVNDGTVKLICDGVAV